MDQRKRDIFMAAVLLSAYADGTPFRGVFPEFQDPERFKTFLKRLQSYAPSSDLVLDLEVHEPASAETVSLDAQTHPRTHKPTPSLCTRCFSHPAAMDGICASCRAILYPRRTVTCTICGQPMETTGEAEFPMHRRCKREREGYGSAP